jgi:hypothetical protein
VRREWLIATAVEFLPVIQIGKNTAPTIR